MEFYTWREGERVKYYSKFIKIHELLKEYNCKSTFSFEKEYQEGTTLTLGFSYSFLNTLEQQEQIKIDATLDVEIKIKSNQGETLRFDIDYSQELDKYSMYISIPQRSSKCISVNKGNYISQEDIILEVEKWLRYYKCKKHKCIRKAITVTEVTQLSFI